MLGESVLTPLYIHSTLVYTRNQGSDMATIKWTTEHTMFVDESDAGTTVQALIRNNGVSIMGEHSIIGQISVDPS